MTSANSVVNMWLNLGNLNYLVDGKFDYIINAISFPLLPFFLASQDSHYVFDHNRYLIRKMETYTCLLKFLLLSSLPQGGGRNNESRGKMIPIFFLFCFRLSSVQN